LNILFLSRWFPYPSNNGSKLRIAGLLRELAQHHTITLVSFTDQSDVQLSASELQSMCSVLHTVPWREFNPNSWRARLGFFSLQPRFLIDTHSEDMANLISNLTADKKFDMVIASQLSMAAYFPYFHATPAIFEELELGQFYDRIGSAQSSLKRFRSRLTWFKLNLYLNRLLDAFGKYTTASTQEYLLFCRHFPAHEKKLAVIPNCIQVRDYQISVNDPAANRLIYSGSFRFYANYEAMQWFVGNVFPRVLAKIPDTHLIITGDHAGYPLPSIKNVTLTGYVDDIKAWVAASAISVAPLQSGGGTRLKILEAMALGVPVVTTSKGAEGLDVKHEEHLLIADSADDFAKCIVRVLTDKGIRDHLVQNAKKIVSEKYDWPVVVPHFLRLMESIVSN